MSKQRDEYFTKRFKEIYKEKWKSKGWTQEEFAFEINNLYGGSSVTGRDVSCWLNGRYPEKYLPYISEALTTKVEDFFPSSEAERYQFEKEYQRELYERQNNRATSIGLNPEFLRVLKTQISFDETFPMYKPHCLIKEEYKGEKLSGDSLAEYLIRSQSAKGVKRMLPAESADLKGEECDLYQIRKGNRIHTLHIADLHFLKEVQDKVCEYIQFLFYEREQEMNREDEIVNKLPLPISYRKEKTDKGAEFMKFGSAPTSEEKKFYKELLKIDRFRKYFDTEEELKKTDPKDPEE